MKLPIPDSELVSVIIQSICRTLLHSVWQGLILAVVAGIILTATKKSKPALRYNFLVLSLLVFIGAVSFTFYHSFFQQIETVSGFEEMAFGQKATAPVFTESFYTTLREITNTREIERFSEKFLKENGGILVAIWLLIFSLKSLRALGGLLYINKLKRGKHVVPEEFWTNLLGELALKMGIHDHIKLLQSGEVAVPMVAGILKPVIFVPISFFTHLPADQIEAILLHELAHIKRRDYAVNLIQNFCENIFFFNPAVLWISALIREEREHCCDDLAISVMKDRALFVEALVSFQEHKFSDHSLAMPFPGKRNFLLDRIKRIIYKHNKPLNAMEKLFVTTSLITATLMTAAFSPVVKEDLKLLKPKLEAVLEVSRPEAAQVVFNDTLPKKQMHEQSGRSSIQTTKNDKRYEIENVNGKLTSLKINGEQISEDNIASHQDEINEIMIDVKKAREEAEVARGEADKAREKADALRQEAEANRKVAEKLRAEAEQSRLVADAGRKQADEAHKLAEADRLEADKQRGIAEKLRAEAEILRLKADANRKEADEMRKRAEVSRKEAEKSRIAFEKMQGNLIEDLLKVGVIKTKSGLSYKLNSQELIVNGVKQPDALHQKMKNKYVEGAGWEVVYDVDGRTGISVTK